MAIGWTLRDAILGHPAHVDNPAKPYSLRGPIYVPISGRGTITRGLTTDTIRRGQVGNILSFDAGKKTVTLKRNKSTLGGREVCEDGTPRCEGADSKWPEPGEVQGSYCGCDGPPPEKLARDEHNAAAEREALSDRQPPRSNLAVRGSSSPGKVRSKSPSQA